VPQFPIHHKVLSFSSVADGARYFGCPREKGRKHAACDLYAPAGTPIHAVADGTFLRFAFFYWETWAVEVLHPGVGVVRYGEVMPPEKYPASQAALRRQYEAEGLKAPDTITVPKFEPRTIKEGDIVGHVGQLVMTKKGVRKNFKYTMLHFELYDEAAAGTSLTVRSSRPYERSSLLRDPTAMLLRLQGGGDVNAPRATPTRTRATDSKTTQRKSANPFSRQ
jgi:hypothetical protein